MACILSKVPDTPTLTIMDEKSYMSFHLPLFPLTLEVVHINNGLYLENGAT